MARRAKDKPSSKRRLCKWREFDGMNVEGFVQFVYNSDPKLHHIHDIRKATLEFADSI